jgi:hypothetical protein
MSVDNNQTSKAFPYSSFMPFYFNGLAISNDATTPNTILDVAPGSCLDSTGTFQLTLPTAGIITTSTLGLNGIDTGTIAASKVYAVYLVADPVTQQPTGLICSLNVTTPLLPFSYSAYAKIGYFTTDSSAHILKGYWSDNDAARRIFTYDAFISVGTTSTSATYVNVDLTKFVPLVNNLQVQIYASYTPGVAGNFLSLQAGNATGAQQIITGQVASIAVTNVVNVLAQTVAISTVPSPVINYKNSGTDTIALSVAGYTFDL